jgi:hypothetical protein
MTGRQNMFARRNRENREGGTTMVDLYALESRQNVAKHLSGSTFAQIIGWAFMAGCLVGAGLCAWAAVTL